MPRTLEDIHRGEAGSATLRGIVSVLNDKLALRTRYALLEYESGLEGRLETAELYQALSRSETDAIGRLFDALVSELDEAALTADLERGDARDPR